MARRFWMLFAASSVSNLGDGIVVAAVPLLAARLTRDSFGVAVTSFAARLPWLLFALVAGAVVDRFDRRRVMVVADVGRVVLFACIAVVVVSGEMSLILLWVGVFIVGLCETMFDTAAMSVVPAIVAREQLDRANAYLDSSLAATNEMAGPAVGGWLFVVAAALPFGVNAVSFAASAALVMSISGSGRQVAVARHSMRREIRDGLRFLWAQRGIRSFAIGAAMINLGYTAGGSVLVLHATENLGVGERGFGVLLAAGAAGGVIGAVAAPLMIGLLGRYRSVLLAAVVMAFGVAIVGLTSSAVVAAAGLAVFTFAAGTWNVVSVSHRQRLTPEHLLGRVMAGFRLIAYGAFPLGALTGGIIASVAGLRATFYFGAAVIAAIAPVLIVIMPTHDVDHTAEQQKP